jgi:hypothetical protein
MMDETRKRRWLVVSFFSRIDGMACSQHIDDRIPCFKSRGIEPLMLTGTCGERWRDLPHCRAATFSPSGWRFELRHLKKKGGAAGFIAAFLSLLILPFYLIEKLIINLDSEWSWFPLAIVKGSRMYRQYQPELIYSTGGPASAHLAAAIIAKRHKLPWIAEFQDPLVHGDWHRGKRALKVFTWLERLICRRADAVIFLTDGARHQADRRTGLGARGWTVYPGANPGAMPDVVYRRNECCHFAHFGSLGGSRNLKVFLEALALLLAARPEFVALIRLDLYGTCDRLSLRLIREFPFQGMIHNHGRIPHSESLAIMKRADVLLLIQNTEEFSSETIPSKTYEYLFARRPILALVHENLELARMMSERGHISVEAKSPDDVKGGMAEMTERWIAQNQEPSSIEGFNLEQAVNALIGIGDGAVTSRNNSAGVVSKGGKE